MTADELASLAAIATAQGVTTSEGAALPSAADPEMRPARPVEDYIDHEEDQEGAKGVARTGGMIKHRTPSSSPRSQR